MIYKNVESAEIKMPTYVKCEPFVGTDGIYMPCQDYVRDDSSPIYRMVISREMFIDSYNMWIKGEDGYEKD